MHDLCSPASLDGVRGAMAGADVIVVHETDGRKYLQALAVMAADGEVKSLAFYSASVVWRLLHCLLRERRKLRPALSIALSNLWFRCRLPFLRNKVIVLAIAPWDWRMVFYYLLLFPRNRIIYNSSWPWWQGSRVPRRYGILTFFLRQIWHGALRHRNVTLSAVTRPAAAGMAEFLRGRTPQVVPHVVGDEFFVEHARRDGKLKLLFVGDLLEKKGFAEFASLVQQLGDSVEVEIVGDGPLRQLADGLAVQPGCRWHGRVTDRKRLASIMAECHIFVSPAQKTPKWEELFGMAIAESMALGLVCIVTDHIGPRSIIRHGVDGILVPQGEPHAIMAWVKTLQDDTGRWRSMSEAARVSAREYAMPHAVELWRALVGSAASKSGVASRPGPSGYG